MNWSVGTCWWKSLPFNAPPAKLEGYHILPESAIVGLIRAVHEKGADFRFMARGHSMYPSIEDGDIITISPFRGIMPYAGEVAAFLKPDTGKLIAHRIIAIENGSFLVKGDNNPGPDGIVAGSGLLGAITRVERHGKAIFWPGRFRHRYLSRIYFSYFMPLAIASRPYKHRLLQVPGLLQDSGIYRRLAKRVFCPGTNKIDLKGDMSPLSRNMSPVTKDVTGLCCINSPQENPRNQLTISAEVNGLPAGRMQLLESPHGCPLPCWWVMDAYVRFRYRGCGLEESMLGKACESLDSDDESFIRINLPASSRIVKTWLKDAGFRPVPSHYPGENNCGKPRDGRIILEKRTGEKV